MPDLHDEMPDPAFSLAEIVPLPSRDNARIRVHDYMNDAGHTSFGWDESDDEWVIPMIRAKMEQGFVFWIVKRNPLREIRLERVEDAGDRHVIIRDDAARTLFEQGRIGLVASDDEHDVRTERRATSAEDAASHDAVVHRRLRGG
jgi:hypothetical protein